VVDNGGVPAGRRDGFIRQGPVEICLRVATFGGPALLQGHETIGGIVKPVLRADDGSSLIASDSLGALINNSIEKEEEKDETDEEDLFATTHC
jgi:hypothetical protein